MINDNTFNWLGNRVVDSGSSHQAYTSTARERSYMDETPKMPVDQNDNEDLGPMRNMDQAPMRNEDQDQMGNQNQGPLWNEQGPPPVMNKEYLPGYLQTIIGKNVRAEFLLGGTLYLDKAGILREVGVNYFVLEDYISHARILCDLYSVKFITTL